MDEKDIINPFQSEEPNDDKNKVPTKKELWMVLAVIVLLLAIMLLQRR